MRFNLSAGKVRALALIALISCCCQANALPLIGTLALQGSAVYSQLQHDYYHAELYGNPGATEDYANNAQLMKLTILAADWSRRNFNQYWSQAVSINNNDAVLESLASDLEAFRSAFKGNLKLGDQLIISRHAGPETKVSLNNVELFRTSSNELFQGLLRGWIGQRPPSSQFKSAITGELPAQELPQLSVLQGTPSEARKKEILSWPAARKSTGTDTAKLQSTGKADARKVARLPEAETLPGTATNSVTKAASKPVTKTAASGTVAKSLVTAQNPVIVGAKPGAPVAGQQPTPANANGRVAATPSPAPAANAPANNESTTGITAETAQKIELTSSEKFPESGLIKVYRSNLLKLTYQKLIYPTGAINRNQEGKVVLQLTLNRQGKVKQVELESPSAYSLLNKAATKAVKKAGPFPAVPRALQGNEIVVSLPINFVLGD